MSNIPYAQLNDAGQVVALSKLSAEVEHPSLVRLKYEGQADFGDLYQNGEFIKPEAQ